MILRHILMTGLALLIGSGCDKLWGSFYEDPPAEQTGDMQGGGDMTAGVAPPASLALSWARRFGSAGIDIGTGVVLDPGGEVVAIGKYGRAFDLDGQNLPDGEGMMFAAKLKEGDHTAAWRQYLYTGQVEGPEPNAPVSAAIDKAGDVVIAGYFHPEVRCGDSRILSGQGDAHKAFVVKLHGSTGACFRQAQYVAVGERATAMFAAVAINKTGEVYVTGWFTSQNSGKDILVFHYDADLVLRNTQRFGSSGDDAGRGIAIDGDDNVIVTGSFSNDLSIGMEPLRSKGGHDVFLVKLDKELKPTWAKAYGGMGTDDGLAVAATAAGDIALTGRFQGTSDFSAPAGRDHIVQSMGKSDGFVVSIDPAGKTRWAGRFGGGEEDEGRAVVIDHAGTLTVAGVVYDVLSQQNIHVLRYPLYVASNALLQVYTGAMEEHVWSMAAHPDGSIALIGGSSSPAIRLGNENHQGLGLSDVLVMKLAP
jgi:hypothetical protein